LGLDKIAIITALNVVHQLLMLEQQKNQHTQVLTRRLTELDHQIENALACPTQMERESEE
jgi:cell division protein ZapA (FtsZ GTPase activity inhibitor)